MHEHHGRYFSLGSSVAVGVIPVNLASDAAVIAAPTPLDPFDAMAQEAAWDRLSALLTSTGERAKRLPMYELRLWCWREESPEIPVCKCCGQETPQKPCDTVGYVEGIPLDMRVLSRVLATGPALPEDGPRAAVRVTRDERGSRVRFEIGTWTALVAARLPAPGMRMLTFVPMLRTEARKPLAIRKPVFNPWPRKRRA